MENKKLELILVIILVIGVVILIIIGIWYANSEGYKEEQLARGRKCEKYGGDHCQNRFKGECVLDCKRFKGEYFKYSKGGFGANSCACIINGEPKSIW